MMSDWPGVDVSRKAQVWAISYTIYIATALDSKNRLQLIIYFRRI